MAALFGEADWVRPRFDAAADRGRQEVDLLAPGVRHDDVYLDRGVRGARASRPSFDKAFDAVHPGDTLFIATLDRLGRSTQNMLTFADDLRTRGSASRVLNLGRGDVDTTTPMGSMLFTIMAALAQMEVEIKRERVVGSLSSVARLARPLGRSQPIRDSQVRNALRLVQGGEPAAQVARDFGMSRTSFYSRSRDLSE